MNAYETTLVVLDLKEVRDYYFREAPSLLVEANIYKDVISLLINTSDTVDYLEYLTNDIFMRIDDIMGNGSLGSEVINSEFERDGLELFGIELQEFLEGLSFVLFKYLNTINSQEGVYKIYDWPREDTVYVLMHNVVKIKLTSNF